MADTGVQARRSAVYLLDQVLGDEPRLMSELLASGALDKLPPMTGRGHNVWHRTRYAGWSVPTGCCKNICKRPRR